MTHSSPESHLRCPIVPKMFDGEHSSFHPDDSRDSNLIENSLCIWMLVSPLAQWRKMSPSEVRKGSPVFLNGGKVTRREHMKPRGREHFRDSE